MAQGERPAYQSADLLIDPERGQVTNSQDESIRLGPVNMKVLEALVSRAGQVVSRADLYQAVWGNQEVGEDALTRCVSDIRAELNRLAGREDLIETLPKRGYRWTRDVQSSTAPLDHRPARSRSGVASSASSRDSVDRQRRYVAIVSRGLTYLAVLVVISSLSIWLVDRLTGRPVPIVAVLPVAAASAELALAETVENELIDTLMGLDSVEILSRSAVASRPANPFPFFFYEFGARWVVEAELQSSSEQIVLRLALVDSRTGIVLMQHTKPIGSGPERLATSLDESFQTLVRFIEMQTIE